MVYSINFVYCSQMDTTNKEEPQQRPVYFGIFAKHPKQSIEQVNCVVASALQDVRNHIFSVEDPSDPTNKLQRQATPEEILTIEPQLDLNAWIKPPDNYHVTCLYLGEKSTEDLSQKERQIYKGWKNDVIQPMINDFIVYVPNYLMVGSVSDLGDVQCANEHPHMTLFLRPQVKAFESNNVLRNLHKAYPDIFKKRTKKVTSLSIPYQKSDIMFIIDTKFSVEGITGNDLTHGQEP